jgi:hypothetical protein
MEKDKKSARALHARRDVLRLGVVGAAAIPLVITLAPKQARAQGSWQNDDPNDPYANAMMNEPMYGTWEWRQQKLQNAQQQQALRARYGGFGE